MSGIFDSVLGLLGQHNRPWIVSRNPAISRRRRRASQCSKFAGGRQYQMFEENSDGSWTLVGALTVTDGRHEAAASAAA